MSTMLVLLVVLIIGQNWLANITKPPIKANNPNQVLNIYNWGDYIDPALLAKFTRETGYKVNYDTFDSNQALETKVKQGGTHYDVIFPSEYLVNKLGNEGYLTKLDYSKIKGFNNLSKFNLNKAYDPHNRYSIPYFWGTTGIVYNTKMYKESQVDEWRKLWNPMFKNQVILIDGTHELLQVGFQSLGYSVNNENQAQIHAAYNHLIKLAPNIRGIDTDEKKAILINGDGNLAEAYNGDAETIIESNPNFKYVIPKDGSAIWTDNMVIPKNADNKKAAYAFINFMLQPKNAAENAAYVDYSSPNKAALKYLPKSITQNPVLYPDLNSIKHAEHYDNQTKKFFDEYNELALDIKVKISQLGG